MTRFIFGAIVGALAMWIYGDQIQSFLYEKTRAVRAKAADSLMSVAETVEGGIAEGGDDDRTGFRAVS